jgi:peptide/nickel transport system permease protein
MQAAATVRQTDSTSSSNILAAALAALGNSKASLAGAVGLGALIGTSLIGPLVAPSPYVSDVAHIYEAPSVAHWLGTDFAGRDNLALLVYGGADILLLAVLAGLLMTLIGVLVGAIGAYLGGKVDALLTGLTDIWLTVPRFILLIVISSVVRIDSTVTLAVLIAIFSWPALARLIRSQVLSLRRREFVEAAQLLDLGTAHIVGRELLPNMMAYVAISLITGMTQAIYTETMLVLLGTVPLTNNWSVLFSLAYNRGALSDAAASWSLVAPMGAIVLLQLFLVLVARGLEEAFNPRLRTER